MNERIQELASHCFASFPEENDLRDYTRLVLWECVKVLHGQLVESRRNEKVHLGLGDVRYTIGMDSDFEDMLKQHFGVE